MKTKAILLKVRRDKEENGYVSGALCVADASAALQRPHIYHSMEALQEDARPVRAWRTVSFARYHSEVLPPGLYEIKPMWSYSFHRQRPYIILPQTGPNEPRMIMRPARVENEDAPFAFIWDEPHSPDIEVLKEVVLRRRIMDNFRCGCRVFLRVD